MKSHFFKNAFDPLSHSRVICSYASTEYISRSGISLLARQWAVLATNFRFVAVPTLINFQEKSAIK